MTVKSTKRMLPTNISLNEAARIVVRDGLALVIKSRGAPVAAVVPMSQYRLAQAFVRKQQDDADAEHTRAALSDLDPSAWSSLDDLRKEFGLDRKRPPVRKKSLAETATRPRRKAARHR